MIGCLFLDFIVKCGNILKLRSVINVTILWYCPRCWSGNNTCTRPLHSHRVRYCVSVRQNTSPACIRAHTYCTSELPWVTGKSLIWEVESDAVPPEIVWELTACIVFSAIELSRRVSWCVFSSSYTCSECVSLAFLCKWYIDYGLGNCFVLVLVVFRMCSVILSWLYDV